MLTRPDYSFWIAQRDAQVIAFAIVHASSTHSIALLEYLAVHHSLRGLGLGRRLLQHIFPVLLEAHRSVLIEVESDQAAAPEPSLLSRRKQFYQRFGAHQIAGLCYRMPQVSSGTPPPMDLLLYPAAPKQTLSRSTLRDWLTSLYVEVYSQSSADPRLTTMLASLPEEIPLV